MYLQTLLYGIQCLVTNAALGSGLNELFELWSVNRMRSIMFWVVVWCKISDSEAITPTKCQINADRCLKEVVAKLGAVEY